MKIGTIEHKIAQYYIFNKLQQAVRAPAEAAHFLDAPIFNTTPGLPGPLCW